MSSLRPLLAAANDAPYDLGAVAEEKCFGRGLAGEPVVRVFDDGGSIRGVAVSCGKSLRLIAVAHEHRRRGIGTALLRDAAARIIGAEPGNYFTPGVWEGDVATIAFLQKHGYRQTGTTWNLRASLAPRQREEGGRTPGSEEKDTGRMLDFIERHFGKAWRFEASRGRVIFLDDIGFVVYEANNRGLGTFGPLGIIKSMRGHGHGRELLLAALGGLRDLGYRQAIIPWTDAIDFYRNVCGAEPAHRFLMFAVDSAP